jgi:hypothetical protein
MMTYLVGKLPQVARQHRSVFAGLLGSRSRGSWSPPTPLTPSTRALESLHPPKEAAMTEATPAAEPAEGPFRGVWTVHTVESWARAVIDDMVQELA